MEKQKGFKGIGPNEGKFVPAEDALIVAFGAVGIVIHNYAAPDAKEFRKMLLEWYYSGNWIEVVGDG